MFLKDLKEFNLPKLEGKVLEFWKKNQVFERTLENRKTLDVGRKKGGPDSAKATKGKKHFVFFEGPPTANGRPGIHNVLARAFKDVVLRYKTMRGYYAPRRAQSWLLFRYLPTSAAM